MEKNSYSIKNLNIFDIKDFKVYLNKFYFLKDDLILIGDI